MKLKLSKEMLESALIFSAKSDVRYYLNGVCFKPGGVFVSTDGHRLFYGHHKNDSLQADIIVSNVKSPTKRYDVAIFDLDSGIVDYMMSGSKVAVAMFKVIDGRFPDVERIMPKSFTSVDAIAFNAGYLSSIEKAAKIFNNRWGSVKLQFSGASSVACCEVKSADGQTAKIVLMPMRIE